MEENSQALFEEQEFEMPSRPLETLKRMWDSVEEQHGRLLVVLVSVIFYTLLSILAPVYSAGIIDLLWEKIQEAVRGGQAFSVTWDQEAGRSVFFLSFTEQLLCSTAFRIFLWPALRSGSV